MTNPVTILFLIDQLTILAGAEAAFIRMIRLLPKDRFRCLAVTFRADPGFEVLKQFPCPLYTFPLRKTYDWGAVEAAAKLRRLIRAENVQIVQTFLETSDIWGGTVAKLSGCPNLVFSRRDMGINRSSKHAIAYRVMKPWVDQVQAVSEEVRRYCIEVEQFAPEKVVTVHNGIDMNWLDRNGNGQENLRQSLGLAPETPVVITVGHVRRIKGMDILIRAASQVCQKEPRTVFLIAGKPHEMDHYQELRKLSESLNLQENVRFLGACDHIPSLLRSSDIFCLLSHSEGFSNAVLEAMACGLPCVVTSVGGNPEAVEEGRSGYLVAKEDPDAAADRILRLLQDPPMAARMGQEGLRIIREKFTADAMIQKLTGFYETLLQRAR